LVWNCLAITGLILITYHAGFDLTKVVSGSMAPTLQGDGKPGSDWLLSERISSWYREPRRWELVQFETEDQQVVAKRVIGLPGEIVSLQGRERTLLINGAVASRPAGVPDIKYLPFGNLFRGRQATCGSGYYVLGDDTGDSFDSRFEGPVPKERIRARPWLIVWPPTRFGFVNP
jgi:signal peptidase I